MPTTSEPAGVLAFPSACAQFTVHRQLSATLPMHCIRVVTYICTLKAVEGATCPSAHPVLAGVSNLHIFKFSSDERVLERLEINERSVFRQGILAMRMCGDCGRRGVVCVGGVVSALRRELVSPLTRFPDDSLVVGQISLPIL
jgi:hypothetical protein